MRDFEVGIGKEQQGETGVTEVLDVYEVEIEVGEEVKDDNEDELENIEGEGDDEENEEEKSSSMNSEEPLSSESTLMIVAKFVSIKFQVRKNNLLMKKEKPEKTDVRRCVDRSLELLDKRTDSPKETCRKSRSSRAERLNASGTEDTGEFLL